jgi:hypothetical protein
VPDLTLLPQSTAYSKVGGNERHYGPPGRPNDDNNHFGTQATIDAIATIASRFQSAFPTLSVLAVNDMSLPFGGRFDVFGRWADRQVHQYHRVGMDADIRSIQAAMPGDRFLDTNHNDEYDAGENLVFDQNHNGQYDNAVHPRFIRICTNSGAFRARLEYPNNVGGTEHWHVYFWNVGQ